VSRPADANQRWAEMLAGWAIPEPLMASAPERPYFFDPAVFTAAADAAVRRHDDTPSDRVARVALGTSGHVLDVGVGGGAASLRLVAPRAPGADVVVCHHVVYNVADLAPFASALTEHATSRVVVELTAVHPMAWLAPYWEALHGIDQSDRPVADDAVAVLEELGLPVRREDWSRPIQMIGEAGDDRLRRIARRLCLRPDRLDELRQLLDEVPPPTDREVVTLWWSTTS
jgi:hypothetical protein